MKFKKKIDFGTLMTTLICFFFFIFYTYNAVKFNSVSSLLIVVLIIELYNFYIHIQVFDSIEEQGQINKNFNKMLENHHLLFEYIFGVKDE